MVILLSEDGGHLGPQINTNL